MDVFHGAAARTKHGKANREDEQSRPGCKEPFVTGAFWRGKLGSGLCDDGAGLLDRSRGGGAERSRARDSGDGGVRGDFRCGQRFGAAEIEDRTAR